MLTARGGSWLRADAAELQLAVKGGSDRLVRVILRPALDGAGQPSPWPWPWTEVRHQRVQGLGKVIPDHF